MPSPRPLPQGEGEKLNPTEQEGEKLLPHSGREKFPLPIREGEKLLPHSVKENSLSLYVREKNCCPIA